MKRFLAAMLCCAMMLGLAVFPVSAADDFYIETQDAIFPADTTVGDLYITGDCPETIILINVKVDGKLYIEADRAVTVRFQGTSSCSAAEINSKATLIGGEFGSVTVDNAYTTFNSTAETMKLTYDGGLLAMNGQVNAMTVLAENVYIGGSGRAEKVVVDNPGCTINLRCGQLVDYKGNDNVEESSSIIANFVVNPTISPANSVVNATVTFTNVPEEMAGDYRIYWYIGDTLSYYEWSFDMKEGASAQFKCSAHFYDEVNVLPVWVRLVNKSTDEELRFVTKVNVVGYSIQEFEEMDVQYPYQIHLLRNQNVLIVYGMDENGEYTKLVNVFPCSTGHYMETDLGDFEIGLQMRWGSLMADLYGQYSSQFNYNQLFHSVPYWSMDQDNIEWEEYEKLGTSASSGCVRLATIDAKWIFDHCFTGTQVKVYDSDTLPVEKPIQCVILEDYLYRGWDPTDPDPDNPSKAYDPPKLAALNVEHNHPVYSTYIN